MTKPKEARSAMAANKPNNVLTVEQTREETGAQAMARKLLEPHLSHAVTASTFASKALGNDFEAPGIGDFIDHLESVTTKAETGDVAIASRLLAAQALTLDNMFTEFARRAAVNMGEYLEAAERYGRLALKAQSNCRTTLEALAKLHQPREQTVKHVQVNDGGQAVVADHFHTGGKENAKTIKQSDATGATGECAALPGQDPQRNGVPIPCSEREKALQDARRDEPGSA